VAIADLNADGRLDLAVGTSFAAYGFDGFTTTRVLIAALR